ncbi:alpha/beta fold hydrolase, partial [Campylobacter fetus subsp. venerealis]
RLFGTKPPQKSLESELCNDLTPEQTSKIVNEFAPESKALYLTKIQYTLPATTRLYVKLANDKAMPSDLQDKMAKNLHADQVITIHSGHLPMISKAKQLAAILSDFIIGTTKQEIETA